MIQTIFIDLLCMKIVRARIGLSLYVLAFCILIPKNIAISDALIFIILNASN